MNPSTQTGSTPMEEFRFGDVPFLNSELPRP
jgi:hypothetical protein